MNKLIVLVSGWAGHDFFWTPMTKRFKSAGYSVITANMPNYGIGSIENSACQIAIMLQEVRPYYDKIVLCGHSMGGLICRVLIQHLEVNNIDAYISLGTPHNGSYLAYLAPWSASARQMVPNSSFLKVLNKEPWPANIPALSLQASFEEIVLPSSNTKIEFGDNQVIPMTDHLTMPLSQRTFLEMWGWLTYGVFEDEGLTGTNGYSSKMVVQ